VNELRADLQRSLGDTGNEKLDVSQQCPPTSQKANYCIPGYIKRKCGQQVNGGDFSPLLYFHETSQNHRITEW